jgi:SlyX protein
MTDDRVTALEERIAYQDQTIEDLNAAILDLWKEIELLRRQLGKFGDQLSQVANDLPQPPEPPPPHY